MPNRLSRLTKLIYGSGDTGSSLTTTIVVLIQETASSLAVPAVGLVLQFTGYIPNAVQPRGALTGIRIVMGPVPAALLSLGIVCALLYPLSRDQFAHITAELAARRAAAPTPASESHAVSSLPARSSDPAEAR